MHESYVLQIDIRNNSKYGSARYRRAEAKAEEIENNTSMLVFGHTGCSMTECLEEVEGRNN